MRSQGSQEVQGRSGCLTLKSLYIPKVNALRVFPPKPHREPSRTDERNFLFIQKRESLRVHCLSQHQQNRVVVDQRCLSFASRKERHCTVV